MILKLPSDRLWQKNQKLTGMRPLALLRLPPVPLTIALERGDLDRRINSIVRGELSGKDVMLSN